MRSTPHGPRTPAPTTRAPERSARFELDVAAPPEHVFAIWDRPEQIPAVTDAVRRIRCIDPQRQIWEADIAGRQLIWEARVVERRQGERIRWQSVHGPAHRGELRFEPHGADATRMVLELRYAPRGWIERIGAALGLVDRCIRSDLVRIKAYAEATAVPARGTAAHAA